MPQTLADWWNLMVLTLRDPRGVARQLISWNLPIGPRWAAFMLLVTLSAAVTHLFILTLDPIQRSYFMAAFPGPINFAILQGVAWLVMVLITYGGGQAMGGKGRFEDVLLIFTWLQVIVLGFQIVQILVGALIPAVGGLVGIVSLVVFMWLFTVFTTVVHGFKSTIATFVGILIAIFLIGVAIDLAVTMLFG